VAHPQAAPINRAGFSLGVRGCLRAPLLCVALALAGTASARVVDADIDSTLGRLETLAGRQPAQAQSELDSLVSGPARLDAHTQLRVQFIRLLIADAQSRPDDVLALSERIRPLADAVGDARMRAMIAHARVGAFYQLGRSDATWVALQQELDQARRTKDDDPLAQALLDRARFLMKRGEFEQACASITDAERHAHGAQIAAEVAYSNALLAKAVGDSILALQAYRDAFGKFHAVADRTGEADSQAGIGAALHQLGRATEAIEPLRAAMAAYREVGDREGEAIANGALALSEADLGRPVQALASNAEGLRALAQIHSPLKLAQLQIDRAGLLLQVKRAGEALPLIERARPVVMQAEELQLHVQFHRAAANVLAALGRFQEAYLEGERGQDAQRHRTEQLVSRQLAAQRGRLESELLTRENALLRSEADAGQRALEHSRRATRLQRIVIGLSLLIILGTVLALWRQHVLKRRIEHTAETDPLTGVPNRRQVLDLGQRLMNRCYQDGQPYAMLLLDLDRFKQINDRFGHMVGDAALCAVSQTLRRFLRPTDHMGRYGGEEFAVILPGADAAEAAAVAERLRAAVAALAPDWAPGAEALTMSGGIAIATTERADFSQLLVRADQALYRAKNAGRNRIEIALN
jgi:diguanylate cyclase (GGDEF)-like protein